MPTISPTLPNDGETIDAQDVNGPFNAILGVLNGNIDDQNVKPGSLPWSVMDSFSNQIPASAMQDSGNLEKFREDSNISFIPDGLIWSATTGLAGAMTSGSYYSNSGILLPITAIVSRTFTASKDTYVSIAQNGAIAYSEVANGAAQPSLPSNSNWLAKIVTNGSTITSVTDLRQTVPIAAPNFDFTSLAGSTTQWRDWTPSFTNFTGTVVVARYTLIGKFCFFYIKVTQGASVTGQHIFTLPVQVAASQASTNPINTLNVNGYILDAGTAQFPAQGQLLTTTTMGLLALNAAGTLLSPSVSSPTVPMTWVNGQDQFYLSGWYEAV